MQGTHAEAWVSCDVEAGKPQLSSGGDESTTKMWAAGEMPVAEGMHRLGSDMASGWPIQVQVTTANAKSAGAPLDLN